MFQLSIMQITGQVKAASYEPCAGMTLILSKVGFMLIDCNGITFYCTACTFRVISTSSLNTMLLLPMPKSRRLIVKLPLKR